MRVMVWGSDDDDENNEGDDKDEGGKMICTNTKGSTPKFGNRIFMVHDIKTSIIQHIFTLVKQVCK